MKFIDPHVKLLKFNNLYERIEYAARNCYKSIDKASEETREEFIVDKIERKHFSVLEHSNIPILWKFSDGEREDAFYIYEWLQAVKGESNSRIFITMDSNACCIVISGNVRAWMDLFNYNLKNSPLFNEGFLDMLETALYKEYPIFFLDKNIISSGTIEVISEDEAFKYGKIHKSFTFEVLTNRATSHQLVRHRDFSYAQESQRYCNYKLGKFNNEITFCYDFARENIINDGILMRYFSKAFKFSEMIYMKLKKNGLTSQEARAVLPNATATTIIVSGRYPQFMDFIEKRDSEKAQDSIREIARAISELIDGEVNGK